MTRAEPGFYNRHVAPRLVHRGCALKGATEQRRRIVPQASGVVLELGIGSGLNLPYYDAEKVIRVIGVDPDSTLLNMGRRRIETAPFEVEILQTSAEDMPLESATADTALVTYAFCTIPDLDRALQEVRRVLKPGGQLLFCEHGRSHHSGTARWQDRLTPLWRRIAGGCHLNRNISRVIANAGFRVVSVDNYVPRMTPAIVGFHHLGLARPV